MAEAFFFAVLSWIFYILSSLYLFNCLVLNVFLTNPLSSVKSQLLCDSNLFGFYVGSSCSVNCKISYSFKLYQFKNHKSMNVFAFGWYWTSLHVVRAKMNELHRIYRLSLNLIDLISDGFNEPLFAKFS